MRGRNFEDLEERCESGRIGALSLVVPPWKPLSGKPDRRFESYPLRHRCRDTAGKNKAEISQNTQLSYAGRMHSVKIGTRSTNNVTHVEEQNWHDSSTVKVHFVAQGNAYALLLTEAEARQLTGYPNYVAEQLLMVS